MRFVSFWISEGDLAQSFVDVRIRKKKLCTTVLASVQSYPTDFPDLPIRTCVDLKLVRLAIGIPPIFLTPRLGVMMIREVSDGKANVYSGVQA